MIGEISAKASWKLQKTWLTRHKTIRSLFTRIACKQVFTLNDIDWKNDYNLDLFIYIPKDFKTGPFKSSVDLFPTIV